MKFLSFGVLVSLTVGCSVSQSDTGAGTTSANSPATAQVDRLLLQGKKILDPNRVEIQLRGWNWGQWDTFLAGDLAGQGFPHADPNDRSDGADAHDQRANVVRILLRWWGKYGDNTDRFGEPIDSRDENGVAHVSTHSLAVLDEEIAEATKNGLWVVLAVDSNCGQESPDDDDPDKTYCNDKDRSPVINHANFVNDPAMKTEFMQLWTHLVNTYKSHDHIAMYEILPEPQFGCTGPTKTCDYDAVRSFYTDLITTIRSEDTITPILIGAGHDYSMENINEAWIPDLHPDGMNPNNLIYTANMLSQEAIHMFHLDTFLTFRKTRKVPLFVQQVGIDQSVVTDAMGNIDSATYLDDVTNVLQALDTDNIGWTWWTYREQNSSQTGFSPWYLAAGKQDTWVKAVAPNMLGTISANFAQ